MKRTYLFNFISVLTFLLSGLLQVLQTLPVNVGLVQARVVVKQVGHKGEVELVHALSHVLGRDEAPAAELLRLLQHHLRPTQEVGLHQRLFVDPGVGGRDLVEEEGVRLAVLDVVGEVVDAVRDARPLQLEVYPAEQDGLGAHLHQTLELLPAHQEVGEAGTLLEADLVKQADPDNLPQQPEHEVGRALDQVVGVNVDDVAADALSRGERQGQVFMPASLY